MKMPSKRIEEPPNCPEGTAKIINARVRVFGMFDINKSFVEARLDDRPEAWCKVFNFYPDELSFSDSEFTGLTIRQARELKLKKDQAFLRS